PLDLPAAQDRRALGAAGGAHAGIRVQRQMNEYRLKQTMVRVARRLDQKGILTSTDGNLSALLDDGGTLITPSGSCKGELQPEELVGLFRGRAPAHRKPL